MKLGELRGLIRKTKGNVSTRVQFAPGGPMVVVALQKTPLLEELERAYPGGRNVETGITFDSDKGCIFGAFDTSDAPNASQVGDAAPAGDLLLDDEEQDASDDLLLGEPESAVEDDDDLL